MYSIYILFSCLLLTHVFHLFARMTALNDFYKRTTPLWSAKAYESTQSRDGKELRRAGFSMAEKRYEEVRPLLSAIAEAEEEQRKAEAEALSAVQGRKGGGASAGKTKGGGSKAR
jgi:hypothetical protein